MYSFCAPCVQFKVIAAVKLQYGFYGFTYPFNRRYLSRTITLTVDDSHRGYETGFAGTYSQTDTIDQHTGVKTTTGSYLANGPAGSTSDFGLSPEYPFSQISGTPTNQYIISTATNYHEWDINGDGSMTQTLRQNIDVSGGYTLVTMQVSLSSEYTTSMLDTDADSIIASVDTTALAWNSVIFGAGSSADLGVTDYMPSSNLTEMLPSVPTYAFGLPSLTAVPQTSMQAVAWSGYAYGAVSATHTYPNVLYKAAGIVQMLGQYGIERFNIDWGYDGGGDLVGTISQAQPTASATTCGNQTFLLEAPPANHAQSCYIIPVPGATAYPQMVDNTSDLPPVDSTPIPGNYYP